MARRRFETEAPGNGERFAERLRGFRAGAGLTQEELGNRLNLSKAAVANWEAGRTRPDIANIPMLCRVLQISIPEFFADESPIGKDEERQLLRLYRRLNSDHRELLWAMAEKMTEQEETAAAAKIHVLEYAGDTAAAGIGDDGFDGRVRKLCVRSTPLTKKADMVFRVSGDSMQPDYPDGCMVLVQKGKNRVKSGDTGIFQVNGALYIKQLRAEGLYSLNPAYKTMTPEEYEEIQAVGRVIGLLDTADILNEG